MIDYARIQFLALAVGLSAAGPGRAEIQAGGGAGYASGAFRGASAVSLFGVPTTAGLTVLSGSSTALVTSIEYQHIEFRSLTPGQVFQGADELFGFGAGIAFMSADSQLQLTGTYYASNKLTVDTNIVLTVNGEKASQQNTTTYAGGKAFEGRLRWILNRGDSRGQRAGFFWGIQLDRKSVV